MTRTAVLVTAVIVILVAASVAGCGDQRVVSTDGTTAPDGSTVKSCQLLLNPTQLQLDLTNRLSETFLQISEKSHNAVRLFTGCIDLDASCRSVDVEIPLTTQTGQVLTYPKYVFNWNPGQTTSAFIAVSLEDPSGTVIAASNKDWDIRDDKGHRIYHYPDKPLVHGRWRVTLQDKRTATDPAQVLIAVSAVCSGIGCPAK